MIGYLRTRVRKQPIIALYFEFEAAKAPVIQFTTVLPKRHITFLCALESPTNKLHLESPTNKLTTDKTTCLSIYASLTAYKGVAS